MRRTILAYTVALTGSLLLGYYSWTHEPERVATTDVEVFTAQAESITTIAYVSPEMDVKLTRRKDARGPYFWVELTKQPDATPTGSEPEPQDDHHGHSHGAQGSEPAEEPSPATKDATPSANSPDATSADAKSTNVKADDAKPTELTAADATPPDKGDDAATDDGVDATGSTGTTEETVDAGDPAPQEPLVLAFKGGEAVDELLESFSPLQAKRVVGSVDDDRLAEFGIGDDAPVITVEREGHEPARFEVGELMFGGRTAYLRDPDDGRVFVIEAKIVRILRDADQRLVERRLLAAEPKDITRVSVNVGGQQHTFVQHNPDDPAAAYWTRDGEEERDEAADTWVKKAVRLRASESRPAEAEAIAGAQERFGLTVATRNGETTHVSVFEVPGTAEGKAPVWWAESDFTRATVRVFDHLASDLAATAAALGEQPAE